MRDLQEKKLRYIMTGCYSHYGTKTDGSPLGCNAEVLSVRMVDTRDHSIVNLLISVRLFDNALTGEMIANHILKELARWDLAEEDWKVAMMDRAKTNVKSFTVLSTLTRDANPSFEPCLSHTFALPGREFDAPILHEFRKSYNKSIMFRGALFQFIKKVWQVTPKVAGGVRWYLTWEQVSVFVSRKCQNNRIY